MKISGTRVALAAGVLGSLVLAACSSEQDASSAMKSATALPQEQSSSGNSAAVDQPSGLLTLGESKTPLHNLICMRGLSPTYIATSANEESFVKLRLKGNSNSPLGDTFEWVDRSGDRQVMWNGRQIQVETQSDKTYRVSGQASGVSMRLDSERIFVSDPKSDWPADKPFAFEFTCP